MTGTLMKTLGLSMACFALVACGQIEKEALIGATAGDPVDVTSTNTCQGTTAAGLTVYRSWHRELRNSDGETFKEVMTVENNAVTLETTCLYSTTQVSVTARVNASINPTLIQTLSNDDQNVTTTVNGKSRVCNSHIDAGKVMNYTFQGSCLKVTTNGISQLMIQ